jgi:hypothetical protein
MLAFVLQAFEPADVTTRQGSADATPEPRTKPNALNDAELKGAPSEAL